MAKWKKIFGKLDDAPVEGPSSADWEAMKAKIDAHPGLNTPVKNRGSLWRAGIVVLLIATAGVAVVWQWPLVSQRPAGQEQAPIKHSPRQEQDAEAVKDAGYQEPGNARSEVSGRAEAGKPVVEEHLQHEKGGKLSRSGTVMNSESPPAAFSSALPDEPVDNQVYSEKRAEGDLSPKEKTAEGTAGVAGETLKISEKDKIADNESTEASTAGEKAYTESEKLALPDNTRQTGFFMAEVGMPRATGMIKLEQPRAATVVEIDLKPAPAANHRFIESGFRLKAVNMGGSYFTDFKTGFSGSGAGVDVDFQKGRFLINTGLHYSHRPGANFISGFQVDTAQWYRVESYWEKQVDSTWVVTGPYQGRYNYDTLYVNHQDSLLEMDIDSSAINAVTRLRHIEVPLLAGYRFGFGRIALDISGGVNLTHTDFLSKAEDLEVQTRFGVDAVFQPALRYYLRPELSVFGRSGVRYRIIDHSYAPPQKLYYQFQMGLTYHF